MSKNQKVLWITLGVVVVLALVVGGVFWLASVGRDDTDEAEPENTTSADPGDGGGSGPNGYEIEAGTGGTAKAKADGQTPTGYDWHCPAAVQAATNYYTHALSGAQRFEMSKAEWDSLIDEINGGLDGGLGPMKDLKSKESDEDFAPDGSQDDLKPEVHPEQGLFQVVECNDGAEATVDVVTALTYPGSGKNAVYSGARLYLSWSENDWRLVDVDEEPISNAFIDAGVEDDSFKFYSPPFPVDAEWRSRAIELLGPSWQEYSNAPQ